MKFSIVKEHYVSTNGDVMPRTIYFRCYVYLRKLISFRELSPCNIQHYLNATEFLHRGSNTFKPMGKMNQFRLVFLYCLIIACAVGVQAASAQNVLTGGYDNARTNANLNETILNPATVSQLSF